MEKYLYQEKGELLIAQLLELCLIYINIRLN